ncbi:MAG: GTPase HflX, partial [Bacteroidales bacterium]
KSTLDEVRETHLLLHVVDISHPDFEEQIKIVEETLHDLQSSNKATILVFNKIDNYTWKEKDKTDLMPPSKENITLNELKKSWMAKTGIPTVFISAKKKENIHELRSLVLEEVRKLYAEIYPYQYVAEPYAYDEQEDKE